MASSRWGQPALSHRRLTTKYRLFGKDTFDQVVDSEFVSRRAAESRDSPSWYTTGNV
jgi:hypothetical protein